MITVQKSGGACGNVACMFSSYVFHGVFWTELKLLSFKNAQIVNKQKILVNIRDSYLLFLRGEQDTFL